MYPDSKIHSFECDDHSFVNLQKNIQANNKTANIFAYKKGIYSQTKTLYFDNWHLVGEKTETSIEVPCISIDDFVREHNITELGLIKMDIEGGEQQALIGAKESIKRFKPKLMIPIYHLENDIVEIPSFLESLDMPMEFAVKWTEVRCWGMDCVLFVRFL